MVVKRGDSVLVALTENREPFVIHSQLSHEALKRLKEEKKFYCPQCGELLQLKIGTIKIPHFAHVSKSRCETSFSEGESVRHLLGKEQLFQLFQSLRLHVKLEPYLPDINQRPDLLVADKNLLYAIEFQCSPIRSERLAERNQGYLRQKIQPVWIPLTPIQKIKRTGLQQLTLPQQLQQFIVNSKRTKYLMTYEPETKQFFYLSNFIHLKGISFFAKVSKLPLFQQQFPFYLPKTLTAKEFSSLFQAYHHFIQRFLKSRVLLSRKGVNDLFLRSVYELRLDIQNLPTFLGVPMPGNEELGDCAVEWQTELLYFIHCNGIKVHASDQKLLHNFFRWSKRKCTKDALQVVIRFVELLNELAVEDEKSPVEEKHLEEVLYRQFLATAGKY